MDVTGRRSAKPPYWNGFDRLRATRRNTPGSRSLYRDELPNVKLSSVGMTTETLKAPFGLLTCASCSIRRRQRKGGRLQVPSASLTQTRGGKSYPKDCLTARIPREAPAQSIPSNARSGNGLAVFGN